MSNNDKLFIDIAKRFAEESHCTRIKVASIIVKEGRIICTGINGTPRGYINCNEKFDSFYFKYHTKEEYQKEHHLWAENNELHSEENSIGAAAKTGISVEGSTMYITHSPCKNCAKLISVSGIKRVVYIEKYYGFEEDSEKILQSQGITLEQFRC